MKKQLVLTEKQKKRLLSNYNSAHEMLAHLFVSYITMRTALRMKQLLNRERQQNKKTHHAKQK